MWLEMYHSLVHIGIKLFNTTALFYSTLINNYNIKHLATCVNISHKVQSCNIITTSLPIECDKN